MSDKVDQLLERVAREIADENGWDDYTAELEVLRRELGPKLRAGWAMKERVDVLSDEVGASHTPLEAERDQLKAQLERTEKLWDEANNTILRKGIESAALKAQRDALLVALKNAEAALWMIHSEHTEAQSADYHAKQAREAIQKAAQP